MIKSTFPNPAVERSAHTARERLTLKLTHLRKADARYVAASRNRREHERLVAEAIANLKDAKRRELRMRVRRDQLKLRYSDTFQNYAEIFQAVGMTEIEITQYFGDLVPKMEQDKQARA